jgi:hypothetical protein
MYDSQGAFCFREVILNIISMCNTIIIIIIIIKMQINKN